MGLSDSLRDEWTRKSARNGRGGKVSPDEAKALLTTSPGCCVGTRYSDTLLPDGPKFVTSNALSVSQWCGWLRDDWSSLSDEERTSPAMCPPDMSAVFKRCYFAHVTTPLLHTSAVRKHESGSLDEHSKRARLALGKYLGGVDLSLIHI